MTDFPLFLEALNRRLLAEGLDEADERRAREFFDDHLSIEDAANLEMIEQDLAAMNNEGPSESAEGARRAMKPSELFTVEIATAAGLTFVGAVIVFARSCGRI